MTELMKARKGTITLQETMADLQEVDQNNLHSYDEYLIEIVKSPRKKGYLARMYEFVATGPTCKDTQMALKKAASFLKSFNAEHA